MPCRTISTSLAGVLALGLAACSPAPTDRPIDTSTAYDCRRLAMIKSSDGGEQNWDLERDLYNQCLREHGY
jgi:hypothetical protein